MTTEEAARVGNEAALQSCHELLDIFGPGKDYRTIVASMATSLLFHSFRLALPESTSRAIEILQVIGDDVAHNVKEISGQKIRFTVTEDP